MDKNNVINEFQYVKNKLLKKLPEEIVEYVFENINKFIHILINLEILFLLFNIFF
jgi:hypothetical protein